MLAVAIYSVIKNNQGISLNFHLIHSKITKESQKRLKKLEKEYANVKIIFHFVDSRLFDTVSLDSETVTIEAFYRYMAVDLLPKEAKALYMDIDMLCLDRLEDLYNTDLEKKCFGAVEDYFIVHASGFSGFRKAIGFDGKKFYNSGMLLMNLQELRESGIIKIFWENAKNKSKFIPDPYNTYADQTISNITFRDKVEFLPVRYNALLTALKYTKPKSVVIAHFTGLAKPYSLKDKYTKEYDFLYYQYYFECMRIIGDDGIMIANALKGAAKSKQDLESQVNVLQRKIKSLNQDNYLLRQDIDKLQVVLNDIINSDSWKITSSLRSLNRILREVRQKYN